MRKFVESAATAGKKYTHAFAALALVSMMSGCQAMDATKTASIDGNKPVVNAPAKRLYRKPLTQMTSVTRIRQEPYAAFVRPQRVGAPAPTKASYNPGGAGPLLGRSPWICGPSGFGQRAACRAR
ncbi:MULTISPECIES: hypothetical protein [unclassified Mesorhizobium]|uniref:hypothetical protein n=1 Tax=unclassified Mesorhizobium TaxID=325217 RepID=UPI0024174EAA|nr:MULTISPECIES: hypothetical protein [unclassified Mesorhizobium]WFP61911.1 hypothetical protein QAZ47_26100 [Mesorhizobium sp. WSM4904]WFP75185.1 hypothetical protein QAZ22_26210 [Mesorhizobium sp. WSM4906]